MKPGFDRRVLLKAALACGFASRDAAAQTAAASLPPQPGDQLVRLGDATATPLSAADVPIGGRQTAAWAMDAATRTVRSATRLNQILLLRLDPEKLTSDTRARAADGVVAYTAICTHNGCDVDDWIASDQVLSCSCHESQFDPKDAARVVDGPAPRPLPALPLAVVDGKLAVAAPFTSRVGFERG